ncbi:zinc finger CCCH domain-containing protein 3 [Asbolus verrucosus]|uniref:Zinc finger CCCH domain-containing protein 3 n=1 Tax=Asbolus verrucosus TaxID=1661398 RepID=A0A482V9D4_ASBVE|nr:zinc finger CCCH domain-containing protein 3 [Asbolus verrucosus]
MNYYPPMSHHHMVEEAQFQYPTQSFINIPTNRFIYVKQNFLNRNPIPVPAPKVLVNPHFKKKVYVNPQFNPAVAPKPKIHVNPNVLKNFAPSASRVPKAEIKPETDTKSTVISTRNKFVRIPCNSPEKVVRKRRNSLHTKYKIVRSTGVRNISINKFKLDKRAEKSVNTSLKSIKKKYVYVNRFLSINIMAKNVLLKKNSNLSKPGFVNINGILYKKSPNSLKKALDSSLVKSSKPLPLSKYKIVRKEAKPAGGRRSLVKRYKLIRSKKQVHKVTPNALRKCNIPCPIYRKFGKCKGKDTGKCFKLHNPDQIVLCTRFLQGACLDKNCLLSHKVSHEKMPTCKYYLDGLCSRDDCSYLHVKISPKADICRDFLEGFCKKGARVSRPLATDSGTKAILQCDKRHQFLCPDFEKNKTCPKRRCPYPHGNTVRNSKVLKTLAKKCSAKRDMSRRKVVKAPNLNELPDAHNRYYKDCDLAPKAEAGQDGDPVTKTVSKNRPKLGDLPAFIPFFEAT